MEFHDKIKLVCTKKCYIILEMSYMIHRFLNILNALALKLPEEIRLYSLTLLK
jgi:hypothetical protein